MSSDSLDNPIKALGVAGTALDTAALLKAGSGTAALASGVAGLAGHASPQLAQALQVASQAHSLAQNVGTLANHADQPAALAQDTAVAEQLAIEEHPLAGQAVSDFVSNESQYVPPTIDPASQDDVGSAVASVLAKFNDGKRLLRFYSPLQGEKTLLIESLSGSSAMSDQFVFNLSLISENAAIDLKDLMGKNVSVGVQLADGSEHFING
jgi:type VI secretion system secreted protein VgrG